MALVICSEQVKAGPATAMPEACAGSAAEDSGGAYRDRTDDPLLAKQVLSQLS